MHSAKRARLQSRIFNAPLFRPRAAKLRLCAALAATKSPQTTVCPGCGNCVLTGRCQVATMTQKRLNRARRKIEDPNRKPKGGPHGNINFSDYQTKPRVQKMKQQSTVLPRVKQNGVYPGKQNEENQTIILCYCSNSMLHCSSVHLEPCVSCSRRQRAPAARVLNVRGALTDSQAGTPYGKAPPAAGLEPPRSAQNRLEPPRPGVLAGFESF